MQSAFFMSAARLMATPFNRARSAHKAAKHGPSLTWRIIRPAFANRRRSADAKTADCIRPTLAGPALRRADHAEPVVADIEASIAEGGAGVQRADRPRSRISYPHVLVLRSIQMIQRTPLPHFPGESRDPLLPWAPAFAGEAGLNGGLHACESCELI